MTKVVPSVLLLNDIHVSRDNIPEFLGNWKEALSVCADLGIKEIAIGGDFFQSRASQTLDILLTVHDSLLLAEKQGVQLIIANGNHDKVDQEAIRGYCHIFDQHQNVQVVDEYLSLDYPDRSFILHLIAYFPENGSFLDKLKSLEKSSLSDDKLNYLYIHQGINGALAQAVEKEIPATVFSCFDKVFVGHYHNRNQIEGAQIEYIGSSRQHNFGEDENKGYTVINSDGTYSFVKNKSNIRYRVFDVPFEKLKIALFDELRELHEGGRYKTKVKVHCTSEQAALVNKQELLNCGVSKVEVVIQEKNGQEISGSNFYDKFDNKKIVKTYEDFCESKNLEDVELGLSYLSKID